MHEYEVNKLEKPFEMKKINFNTIQGAEFLAIQHAAKKYTESYPEVYGEYGCEIRTDSMVAAEMYRASICAPRYPKADVVVVKSHIQQRQEAVSVHSRVDKGNHTVNLVARNGFSALKPDNKTEN